jgi:hypothetical protein
MRSHTKRYNRFDFGLLRGFISNKRPQPAQPKTGAAGTSSEVGSEAHHVKVRDVCNVARCEHTSLGVDSGGSLLLPCTLFQYFPGRNQTRAVQSVRSLLEMCNDLRPEDAQVAGTG